MIRKKILYIANGNSIHDVKWMTYFSEKTEHYQCFLLVDSLNPLSQETIDQLTKLHITVLEPINPISISHPIRTIKAIALFKQLIRSVRPDLIHVLFAAPNALWLNYTKTPSLITMRGSDILVVIPQLLEQKGIKKWYFSFLFKKFKNSFQHARWVTGTSSPQLEKAKKLFGNINVKLIRTGVDVEAIKSLDNMELLPGNLRNKKYIFSPRFMSPIYNIEMQIEAISLLEKKIIEEYVFVFIRGKQFEQDYYNRQLEKLNILQKEVNLNFLIVDYLNQSEMWMMVKNAALCMMTPVSDGTPNTALEAMAAQCPLIVSNLNYDNELFEGTCYKLKSFEVKELKETIEKAIFEPNPEIIANGFKAVCRFGSRKKEMEKLQQVYDSVKQTTPF